MNEQGCKEHEMGQNSCSRERERSDRPWRENEELHDVLIAISVVAKRLASRMETTEEES